jgi:hypothetical protein
MRKEDQMRRVVANYRWTVLTMKELEAVCGADSGSYNAPPDLVEHQLIGQQLGSTTGTALCFAGLSYGAKRAAGGWRKLIELAGGLLPATLSGVGLATGVQQVCGSPAAAVGQRIGRQIWDSNNPTLSKWWAPGFNG